MKRQLQLLTIGLLLAAGGENCAWAQTNLLTADGVSFTCQDKGNSDATVSVTKNADNSITYSCNNEIYLQLSFSPGINIDASKAYVVVEASNAYASGKKLRNIILNGNKYDETGNADCAVQEINSKQILLMSPLGKNGNIFTEYVNAGDNNMSLTQVGFNLKPSTTAESYTIHRISFCSVADILTLYSKKVRFVKDKTSNLRLEWAGTTDNDNKVNVNDNGTITLTSSEASVLFKSMGTYGTYSEVDFRNMEINSGSPLTKECMSNLSTATKVNLNASVYKYFPTTNNNVYIVGGTGQNRYRQFKDAYHPNANEIKTQDSGSGDTKNWYGSYVRNLIAGYSSMMLPYEVSYQDLTAAGLTAYIFGSLSNNSVSFSKLTSGTIAAHTPFIVKAETTGLYLIPSNGIISDWSTIEKWYKDNNYATAGSDDCYFIGSFINEVPGTTTGNGWPSGVTSSTHTFYGITSDGNSLAEMNSSIKTSFYRAFLAVKKSGSSARALTLSFGDETTGIQNAMSESQQTDEVYDLQGRLVKTPTKGIYVKNGKKMIIK